MRKRILTALLAAAMMLSVGAGCYYEEQVPESSEPNTTTSAESKTTTTSKAATTTSQATTTTSKATATSSKKSPTTAKFKYKLVSRVKTTGTTGGGDGLTTDGITTGGSTTTSDSSSGQQDNYYYDEFRAFVSVGDDIMDAAKRDLNRKDPINGGFWRNNGTNLADNLDNLGDNLNGTTLWPYGAFMEGVGAWVAESPSNTYFSLPQYEKLLKNVDNFTDPEYNNGTVLGLACVQHPNGAEIFNDDNVWIALEWINAYKLTKNQDYLKKAQRNLAFIYESWDETIGGGIWWMRAGRQTSNKPQKNACINAPFAWAAAEMYELLKSEGNADEKYKTQATNAYNWTKEMLWDDKNDLIMDQWYQSDTGGYELGANEYAYNTGCMIGAGAQLYKITGDETFRTDAYKLAEGAKNGFFTPRIRIQTNSDEVPANATGYYFNNRSPIDDAARCWFRSNLIKGIYALYNIDTEMGNDADPQYARIALNAVAVGAVNAGRAGGYINPDFKSLSEPTAKVISPLSQGGAARMMYESSKFIKDHRDFNRIPDAE